MNRFAIAVVAAGLALSSALASQGRGRMGGTGGIPGLAPPPGATQGRGGSYGSPGTEGARFELSTAHSATLIEEHYRKQLTAAGWNVESSGGDANIAYSRYTISAGGSARAGTMVVTPIEGGRVLVALRRVESMAAPPPAAPKTEAETMDWMLRQLPRSPSGQPPTVVAELPATFPAELLPARFKTSRIFSTVEGTIVAGTVENTTPRDIPTFLDGLRKAGWSDSLRAWMSADFVVADVCKNDLRAKVVMNVDEKRVAMAGVALAVAGPDGPVSPDCASTARQSPGISGPVVVPSSAWSPAHVDGGGGGSHFRAGVRLTTATPVASIVGDVETQIAASGYKATARTGDANQRLVRFESTQTARSSAVVLLSVTKLPWSPQIDTVYDVVVTVPKR